MKKTAHKKIFDKDYFTDYYFGTTGSFGRKELLRNKNWFYGWFKALQGEFNFKNGKGKQALEIGCAIGAAADILHERGFDVLATDISPYAIKKAQKLLPKIKFAVLDIEEKPKIKNKFDLIYAFEVIEHLENPTLALKNMYSMLKKDGTLICSTPYPYPYVLNVDKTHVNVRYPLEWIVLYRNSGFSKIQYRHKTFIPFFYRFSKHFHFIIPFGVGNPYLNSHVFIIGHKN